MEELQVRNRAPSERSHEHSYWRRYYRTCKSAKWKSFRFETGHHLKCHMNIHTGEGITAPVRALNGRASGSKRAPSERSHEHSHWKRFYRTCKSSTCKSTKRKSFRFEMGHHLKCHIYTGEGITVPVRALNGRGSGSKRGKNQDKSTLQFTGMFQNSEFHNP